MHRVIDFTKRRLSRRGFSGDFELFIPRPIAQFDIEESVPLNDIGNMIAERIPELKNLSPEEKLILVGELWDELAARPDAFPPREDHIKLLRERLEHFRKNPADVMASEQLKARILGSR